MSVVIVGRLVGGRRGRRAADLLLNRRLVDDLLDARVVDGERLCIFGDLNGPLVGAGGLPPAVGLAGVRRLTGKHEHVHAGAAVVREAQASLIARLADETLAEVNGEAVVAA